MSPAHVWACGQCGARVVARVGAIARAFQTHMKKCPALPRRHPSAAAPRRDDPTPPPRRPRAGHVDAKAAQRLREGGL
jgi:hypothetical protein